MSGPVHTESVERRLALVHSAKRPAASRELVVLEPSERLTRFVEAAAAQGLEAADAVRLGFERAMALGYASVVGFDTQAALSLLNATADGARPRRRIGAGQAAYARRLSVRQPVPPADTRKGLRVVLPDDVLTRARSTVRPNVLHAGAVPEMIAWELAAIFEGRSLGEWALRSLLLARRAG